jgi:spore germination protein KC
LLTAALLLSGCTFKDIEKRAFILSIGIDKGEEKAYRISLNMAVPSGEVRQRRSKTELFEFEADSVTTAIRALSSQINRQVDFSHAKVILLGEEIAEKDILLAMDWAFRRYDIQNIAWIAVGSPDANTVLKVNPPLENLPGTALLLFFAETGTESPQIFTEYLFDLHKRLKEPGIDPVLPIVRAIGDNRLGVSELAVFDKKRARLKLDGDRSALLNMLLDSRNIADWTLKWKGKTVTVEGAGKTTFAVREDFKGGAPRIAVNVNWKGSVSETTSERFRIEDLPALEQEIERRIPERIEALLRAFREERVDPIGFGLRYRSGRPGESVDSKAWAERYADASFDVEMKARLMNTGIME